MLPAAVVLAALLGGRLRASPLEQLASPHVFDLTEWEVRHIPGKWLGIVGEWFRGEPSEDAGRRAVQRYFQLTAEINELNGKRDELVALSEDRKSIEDLIAARDEERHDLAPLVESTIEGALTAVLEDLGLTENLPLFDDVSTVWPPVDFVVEETPKVLIISHRDQILRAGDLLLRPDVTLEEAEELEGTVDAGPNTSSLVVTAGGIAFYPAVVRADFSYESTIEIASHEWTHHWLYFKPLGSRYFDGGAIRTINETVANIAGRELAALVRERLNVEIPPPEEGLPQAAAAAPDSAFNFRDEMRELRLEVDTLLAAGRVDEAEKLMEERRRVFAQNGHFIRKINQAYFAFYGTYADSPASSDPLGPKIDQIRNRSGNLLAFLETMANVTSEADVDARLAGG